MDDSYLNQIIRITGSGGLTSDSN